MHRLLVVLALALTACSTGTEPDSAAPLPASGAPSAPATQEASPRPTARTIEVAYAGGEITGVGSRVDVAVGEQVVLRVTSDVVEEIHVHGYDLYADLAPGQPATLSFTADLPGSYEVELHDAGRPLFQLRVA